MVTNSSPPAAAAPLMSSIFPTESIWLDGVEEHVVRGGRRLFAQLPDALRGVERIGVLGWGPQARAQAQNLRDALAGTSVAVTVGLRPDSPSRVGAERCGFTEADGTLGDLLDVAAQSDLVLFLIADAAQVEVHEALFACLRPGTTLGLSHGFLIGWLRATGRPLPKGVNVIAVCPKGMGVSVRGLFQQGTDAEGAGINVSIAIEQDFDGWATDIALAWAIAIGAPFVFATTMEHELRSDLFGERGVLLGAVHGLAESAYERLRARGVGAEEAYLRTAQAITGPIASTISHSGIAGVIAQFPGADGDDFARAYTAAYDPVRRILDEIYDEVASGREIEGVIAAGLRLVKAPMAPLEGTAMWQVGRAARKRSDADSFFDAVTAGAFVGTMMAQVDVLRERGHSWSEIANESVIEAVDSLLPYMRARGVAHMIDNCSVTARLGARRWGPVFEAAYRREVLPAIEGGTGGDEDVISALREHPIHGVLDALREFRPSVDIVVR